MMIIKKLERRDFVLFCCYCCVYAYEPSSFTSFTIKNILDFMLESRVVKKNLK